MCLIDAALPAAGGWRLAAGRWRLAGGWRLAVQ
jgi:hypothetical protein